METQDLDTDWKPRAFEVLKSLAIVGVVAPVVGGCLFWLIMMFPVIFMGQPKEGMIGWGFITIPAAILVAPVIAATVAYCLLKRVTRHAVAYLFFAAVAWFFII